MDETYANVIHPNGDVELTRVTHGYVYIEKRIDGPHLHICPPEVMEDQRMLIEAIKLPVTWLVLRCPYEVKSLSDKFTFTSHEGLAIAALEPIGDIIKIFHQIIANERKSPKATSNIMDFQREAILSIQTTIEIYHAQPWYKRVWQAWQGRIL